MGKYFFFTLRTSQTIFENSQQCYRSGKDSRDPLSYRKYTEFSGVAEKFKLEQQKATLTHEFQNIKRIISQYGHSEKSAIAELSCNS